MDVLVFGGGKTVGTVPCGNVITVVAGAPGGLTASIVLTGARTGTEGFDSNSLAVSRGRLFQRGIHFEYGDVITVAIAATNNQFRFDDEGMIVLDAFGNPTIQYNVGSGQVTVTSAN